MPNTYSAVTPSRSAQSEYPGWTQRPYQSGFPPHPTGQRL